MNHENSVQQAFQATAALFRALGVSQDAASRQLGLRGHTSFSFWSQGRQQFNSRYAVALYRLVVEGVNEHWPQKIEAQIEVTKKLTAVFNAWEAACKTWRKEANEALQQLQQTAHRIECFGDVQAFEYAQELHRIAQETKQLSEALQRIGEFEAAWQRGREEIHMALQRAEGKIQAPDTSKSRPARRERKRQAKKTSSKV